MGKKHTTQAPTAQQATSDQDTREPVIFTAAAFLLFFTAYVLSLLPLAEEMGKKHTTQPLTAQQAASDQDPCEPVIFTTAAFFLFFTAYVLSLLPLAEEMGKKQATQALTAKQAASDQLTDDLFLVSAAALPFATQTSSFGLFEQSIRTHHILRVCFPLG
jgi:hypothetical protein